jgi:hypothetical protein
VTQMRCYPMSKTCERGKSARMIYLERCPPDRKCHGEKTQHESVELWAFLLRLFPLGLLIIYETLSAIVSLEDRRPQGPSMNLQWVNSMKGCQ